MVVLRVDSDEVGRCDVVYFPNLVRLGITRIALLSFTTLVGTLPNSITTRFLRRISSYHGAFRSRLAEASGARQHDSIGTEDRHGHVRDYAVA